MRVQKWRQVNAAPFCKAQLAVIAGKAKTHLLNLDEAKSRAEVF
jgi:hypothetical protein